VDSRNKGPELFEEDPEKKVYTGSKIDQLDGISEAWTPEQLKNMNEKSWEKETKKPSKYQVTPDSKDNMQMRTHKRNG
jgi:hypothetical protein